MKAIKIISIVLTVLSFTNQVNAGENYWQNIKRYIEEDDAHPSAEGPQGAKEYMESLSADELIIAAKQCSVEMESSVDPNDWDVATGNLGFFYQYYPLKTNDLEDVSPLLNDLKDKTQSIFWRRALMELIDSWSDKLSFEECLDAAKIMHEIYRDDSENLLLKPKAIRKSTTRLRQAYSIILRSDPNVKQFMKQQKMRTRELINAIQSDKVKLSPQTIEANKKVLAEINQSITTQLSLFSNKQVDTSLKTSIIVAWARYHKYHLAPPQVSQTLTDAVNNHKNYDEKLWHILIKTSIEDFGNRNASTKLQNMINETKDETVKERLVYLNKKLEKSN